jgi:hypothetical protein
LHSLSGETQAKLKIGSKGKDGQMKEEKIKKHLKSRKETMDCSEKRTSLPGKDAFHFPRRPAVDHAMPCHMTTKT